jgi:hypothetical protein
MTAERLAGIVVEGDAPAASERILTSPGVGLFRLPGIAALRTSGAGTVQDVRGIAQTALANAPGWQRVEVVGLPFARGQVPPPSTTPASRRAWPPRPGRGRGRQAAAAGRGRAAAATARHRPARARLATHPTPTATLATLQSGSPAPLGLLRDRLAGSDDLDPDRQQSRFTAEAVLPSIRQADLPGAPPGPDPARLRLPVTAVLALATASDCTAGCRRRTAAWSGWCSSSWPPRRAASPSCGATHPGNAGELGCLRSMPGLRWLYKGSSVGGASRNKLPILTLRSKIGRSRRLSPTAQ